MFISILALAKCSNLANSMLNYVNKIRRENSLDPFVSIHNLEGAAKDQALYMCENGKLTHENRLGKLESRLLKNGFKGSSFGENIAKYKSDLFEPIINVWLGSAAHKKYILGDYKYSGIATCLDRHGNRYWVQVYGMPSTNVEPEGSNTGTDKRRVGSSSDKLLNEDLNNSSQAILPEDNEEIEISDENEDGELRKVPRKVSRKSVSPKITSTQTVFIVTKSVSLPNSFSMPKDIQTVDGLMHYSNRLSNKASILSPKLSQLECSDFPITTSNSIKTKTVTVTSFNDPRTVSIPDAPEKITTRTVTMTEKTGTNSINTSYILTTSQIKTKTVTLTETLNQTKTVTDSILIEPQSTTSLKSVVVFKTVTEKEPSTSLVPIKTMTKLEEIPTTIISTVFRTVEITKTPTTTVPESPDENNKDDSNIILLVNIPKENTIKGKSIDPFKLIKQELSSDLSQKQSNEKKSQKKAKKKELSRRPRKKDIKTPIKKTKGNLKSRDAAIYDNEYDFENSVSSNASNNKIQNNKIEPRRHRYRKSFNDDFSNDSLRDQQDILNSPRINLFASSDSNDQEDQESRKVRSSEPIDDGFNISINVHPNKKIAKRRKK